MQHFKKARLTHWEKCINDFRTYLLYEKSFSKNTVIAYTRDITQVSVYLAKNNLEITPEKLELKHLQGFVRWRNEFRNSPKTQLRMVTSIRSFYRYLDIEDIANLHPADFLQSPRIGFKLPVVLSEFEIDRMIGKIDLNKPEGKRNKAIIETLYGCGLRVSELVNLKISSLYFNDGYIKVLGKGDKERLVPISGIAMKEVNNYLTKIRTNQFIKKGNENIVFLNRNGSILSREMILVIVKKLVLLTGIKKRVSPHTFRHSYATHLINGGADLRAVQELLGHVSITSTEIYTHMDMEFLTNTILQFHPRN